MAKCIINAKFYGVDESGMVPKHYGYTCTIEDGNLVGEVPDELVEHELAAGRITSVLQAKAPAGDKFDAMDRAAQKAYLDEKGVEYANNISGVNLLALCRETAAKAGE